MGVRCQNGKVEGCGSDLHQERFCAGVAFLSLDCISVLILIVMLYHDFESQHHSEELGRGCRESFHICFLFFLFLLFLRRRVETTSHIAQVGIGFLIDLPLPS